MTPKAVRVFGKEHKQPLVTQVYAVLAEYANADGVCWPSQATIADEAGISERKTHELLLLMADAGFIRIEHRRYSNLYILLDPVPVDDTPQDMQVTPQVVRSVEVVTPHPVQVTPHVMQVHSAPDAVSLTKNQELRTTQREVNVNPPSPLRDSTEKRKRPSRLSEDVALTDDWRSAAETIGIVHDVQWQFDQFKDHNLAKGETALDWRRKWQTWCRNAIAWNKRGPAGVVPAAAPVPVDTPEDRLARTRALFAKLESGEWVHDPVLRERYPDDDNGRRNLHSAKVNLARLIAEAEGQEH